MIDYEAFANELLASGFKDGEMSTTLLNAVKRGFAAALGNDVLYMVDNEKHGIVTVDIRDRKMVEHDMSGEMLDALVDAEVIQQVWPPTDGRT